MEAGQQRKQHIELFVMGALSAVLHQTGFFMLFFAVPVQMLAIKRDKSAFINAAMVSLGCIAIWKGVQIATMSIPQGDSILIMLDTLLPLAVFIGLGLANFAEAGSNEDWVRLVKGGVIAVAVVTPLLLYAQNSPFFIMLVEAQHAFMLEQGMIGEMTVDGLLERMMSLLFRAVGGMVTGMIALNFYFGASLAGWRHRLQRLHMPRISLAAGAAGGIIALLDVSEILAALAWNTVLVVLVLHAFIGIAVLSRLVAHRLPVGQGRWLFLGALLLVLFVPLVNVLVLVALPVAGVLETAIHIRERYWNKE